jgi:hypothetical protein
MKTLAARAAVVLALVLPLTASAQRSAFVGQTEWGHAGGFLFVDDVLAASEKTALTDPSLYPAPPIAEIVVRTGPGFGLRLSRSPSRHFTWEAAWAYTFSELRRRPGPLGEDETHHDRLGIVTYGVGVLAYPTWWMADRLGPFLRVGGGGFSWRPADDFPERARPLGTRRTASFAGQFGGGLTFYATPDLAFRAEYGAVVSRLDRDKLLALFYPLPSIGKRTIVAHRLEVGFSLRFFDTAL